MTSTRPASRILNSLGLHRRELRAWAMYDWAVSAAQTTIMTAVFPIFFVKVAAGDLAPPLASQWFANANTIGAVLIAIMAPLLGALADFKASKKKFLVGFMLVGVAATAAMFFISRGDVLFAARAIANDIVLRSFGVVRLASSMSDRPHRNPGLMNR